MKPPSTVDLATESETTFLTKPDAVLSVGGCLLGVCRDEKAPKIAAGNTSLTDSRLVGLIPDHSLYADCGHGLLSACDCHNTVDDHLCDSLFNKIINEIERLRLGLENIELDAFNTSELNVATMDETRLQQFSFRNPNFKPQLSKLNLAPNFQLTKLTKVAGPPLSPLTTSLPCSPIPNRSPVKLKPDLPYHLSLSRKGEKSLKCVENDDSETGDLEEIRNILSGLDLNKYKRRKGPEGCADTKPEKPSFCRSISNMYPMSSTEQCMSLTCPSTPTRTKLRELTDMLSKNKGNDQNNLPSAKGNRQGTFFNNKENGKDAFHRLVKFSKRSISVPENTADDNFQSSSRIAIKLQPLTGSATLPRMRTAPPCSLPLSFPRNNNITTLNALSLATPVTAALNNDAIQNKETRSYSVSKFPLPPPKIKEIGVRENTNRTSVTSEITALQTKPAEIKMLAPTSGKKQQIAVKPLNFMFGNNVIDLGKKQTGNGHLNISPSSKMEEEIEQLKPASSGNNCLSLVPVTSSISKPTIPANMKFTEASIPEDNKTTIQQRRYFKKKLRGPYGEMLEEEMKKSEGRPKTSHNRDFQMVKELCQLQDDFQVSLYSSSHSLDDTCEDECHTRRTNDTPIEIRNENQLTLPGIQSTVSEPNLSNQPNGLNNKVLAISEGPFISEEDTRTHIVRELHCTEKSYVESLEILVNKYMKALKCADYLEASLVDEIFYQVPRILEHHVKFLETLEQRIDSWDTTQTVGDIFTQTDHRQCRK